MKKLLFLFLLISSFAWGQGSQLCDYVRITNVSQLPDSTVMAVCNGTLHQPGNTRTQAMPFSMLVQKLRQLGIVAFADTLTKIASHHYVDSAVGAAGSGTVTSVSVTTNQGVSGTVATATTTPAITLSLGALTGVTSLNGLVVTPNTGVITTGTWSATSIDTAKTNAVSAIGCNPPLLCAVAGKKVFLSADTTTSGSGLATKAYVLANSGGSGWSLTGNSGTNSATNFIGTTDSPFVYVRVANNSFGILRSDSKIVALGDGAGVGATGSFLVAAGDGAGYQDAGTNVVALGRAAANNNPYNEVVALGTDATPTVSNQFYLSDSITTAVMKLNGGSANDVLTNDGAGNARWLPVRIDSTRLIRTDTIHVTSAEILQLNSSPKVLVGAPPVNSFITVLAVYYAYTYGTTPYTLANTITVNEGDFTSNLYFDATGDIGASSFSVNGAFQCAGARFTTNTPVVLSADGGSDPTGGDGSIIISITYQINHF